MWEVEPGRADGVREGAHCSTRTHPPSPPQNPWVSCVSSWMHLGFFGQYSISEEHCKGGKSNRRASEYRARRYFDVAAHVCAHVIPAPHPHANIEAWTRVCPRQPTTPLPCSMWSGSSFPEAGGRRSIGRDGTSIHVMGGRAKERGRAYLGVRRSWSVFGAFLGSPVGSPVIFLPVVFTKSPLRVPTSV